jgi:hypothetical protein
MELMMSALRLKRGFEKSMIALCWSNRLPKIVELAHNAIETGN